MLTEGKTVEVTTSSQPEIEVPKVHAIQSKLVGHRFLNQKKGISAPSSVSEITVTRTGADPYLDEATKKSSPSQVNAAWPFLVRTKS